MVCPSDWYCSGPPQSWNCGKHCSYSLTIFSLILPYIMKRFECLEKHYINPMIHSFILTLTDSHSVPPGSQQAQAQFQALSVDLLLADLVAAERADRQRVLWPQSSRELLHKAPQERPGSLLHTAAHPQTSAVKARWVTGWKVVGSGVGEKMAKKVMWVVCLWGLNNTGPIGSARHCERETWEITDK